MALLTGLTKYLTAFFFVMFCASASLATTNNLSLWSGTADQTIDPTVKTSGSRECFTGYFTNSRGMAIVLEGKNLPAGSMNECFDEPSAITLHKDGDNITWSLIPSIDKLSINPIDNIKSLQVMLQYRF